MKHDSVNHRGHRPHEMTALIARYRVSGLGLKDFAREQGVPYGRLHYWLYQKSRSRPSHGLRQAPAAPVPFFQEVQLATGLPALSGWTAEISLPQGVVVRVGATAHPSWIGAVVAALPQPC